MSFGEEVTIDIKLKAETGKALGKIGTALTSIKSSAESIGDELDTIEQEVNDFGDSIEERDIEIGGDVDFDSIQEAVMEAKTTADIFTSAAGPSNITVGAKYDRDNTFVDALLADIDAVNQAAQEGDPLSPMKEEIAKSNQHLQEEADNSVTELDREASSFDNLIDSGDSLTDIKQKVADANENVQKMSKESAREIAGEDDEMMNLFESMDLIDEKMGETGDSNNSLRRAIRKMNNAVDETSDSMRAAAQVGDLFEDGLGSLSVNMGAFTIALRNFLTQVPLLLTALGAVGAAALGAASSFVTLAGAMGAIVAAGALKHAQNLTSQYSQLESLGQSLEVIMLNIRDTMMRAAAPIIEAEGAVDMFKDAVQGAAFVVNLLSQTVASLVSPTEDIRQRTEAVGSTFLSLSEAMDMIASTMGPALTELMDALTVSYALLGEEVIWAMGAMTEGLADGITRSANLLDRVESLGTAIGEFSDTISELAELGFRIGGGLLPVFRAFSEIIGTIAGALNNMDSQMMQNAITALALFAALNKVFGVLSNVLTIAPNVALGMGKIAAEASSASGAIATMRAATTAAGAQLGGFLRNTSMLGGFTALIETFEQSDERLRQIAFNSKLAGKAFEDMADDTDFAASQLRELAIQGRLTEEALDDVDDVDFDFDVDNKLEPEQFIDADSSITRKLFGNTDDAAREAARNAKSSWRDSTGRLNFGIGSRKESDSPFKMFADDDDALDAVRFKLGQMRNSVDNTIPSARELGRAFQKNVNAVKQFGSAVLTSATQSLKALYGSIVTSLQGLWSFIFATNASKRATLKDIAVKYAGAAANLALAAAEWVATSGALALASALVVATGGILLLIGLIGALAVGLITNFSDIKSAAKDTFGFLKQAMDIIVDVLITYFIAYWNLLVDVFEGLMAGLSPLIDMFFDLGKSLGLVGGEAGEGASAMDMLAAAGEWIKDAIGVASTILSGFIDILAGVLTIVSVLIRVALIPVVIAIQLLVEWVKLAIDMWDWFLESILGVEGGVGGLIDIFMKLFDSFMRGMSAIPSTVEMIVNSVIRSINKFLSAVSSVIPGVSLGQMEEISLSSSQSLKTDRDELSADTKSMRDGTEPKGDKKITYTEDNSTNIDQTVNADPEDQAQLSRVVTDAIEEANSFQRRQQGGQ